MFPSKFIRRGVAFAIYLVTLHNFAQGITKQSPDALFLKSVENKTLSADSLLFRGRHLNKMAAMKNDQRHRAQGNILMGLAFLTQNKLDSASGKLFEALSITDDLMPQSLEAGLVHLYLGSVFTQLNNHARARAEFESATEIFKQIRNIEYISSGLLNIGTVYGAQADYPKALKYFLQAKKVADQGVVSNDLKASIVSDLATVYSLMKKYPEALTYAFQALDIDRKSNNQKGMCYSYNAIGNVYRQKGNYDSALMYYQKTMSTVDSVNPEFAGITTRTLVNISGVLIEMGKPREAIRRLHRAQAANVGYQAEILYNNLANYYEKLHRYDSAIINARKALQIARAINSKDAVVEAAETLHESFLAQKRVDSAYAYIQLQHAYGDSIYNESNLEKFSNLRIELETLEKERELSSLKNEAELHRAETELFRVYMISAALIAMLIMAGVVLFYQNEQRKQQLKNIELQEKLEKQNNDLRQQALKMIYINNGLTEVEDSLRKIKHESGGADIQHVLSTIHVNRSLEKEWDNFNSYFSQIHTGFFERLNKDHPNLTITDKRLAGLVRMNLTNREIAGILNIEDASVKTAKYRLKKKLELTDDQNLHYFLLHLVDDKLATRTNEVE